MKTTAEMIAVMQAFDRGEKIEGEIKGKLVPITRPVWDWTLFDYRVVRKPAECWVWVFPSGRCGVSFESEAEALRVYDYDGASEGRAVLMREATE